MPFTLVPQMSQSWAWLKGLPAPWEQYFGIPSVNPKAVTLAGQVLSLNGQAITLGT